MISKYRTLLLGTLLVGTSTLVEQAQAKELESTNTRARQLASATRSAKAHTRSFVSGDFQKLEKTYAANVILMPGHEFLKAKFGLAGPKGRKEAITVDREKLVGTIEKQLEDFPGRPADKIDIFLNAMTYKVLETKIGDYAADPPDPVDTPDGKIHFTIADGDVLFKVGPKKGDHILLQMRQINGAWMVVAELID